MARNLKIVQAASDDKLKEGSEVTNITGYAKFLHETLAPIHQKLAAQNGYEFEYDITTKDVHPFWMKAFMIQKALADGFEFVVWLDSDVIWLGEPLDVEFQTVFGMTYHVGYGAYDNHFNAGVIYVNNQNGQAVKPIADWYAQRIYTCHDQDVLNANHTHQITKLDHAWNSSIWIEHYSSPNPKIIAWHGCPNRIHKMEEYIKEHNP